MEQVAAAPAAPAAFRQTSQQPSLLLPVALLVLLTVGEFLPALSCGFVSWDDPQSSPEYAIVLRGLSAAGVAWAFTHSYFAHWLPLTVLSHMLDWELFGSQAGGHHLTSLLLHAGSAVLVLLLWRRATGRTLPALAVAAFFAVHPLRVEPVVWLSSRKDLLSTFFGLLALVLYVGWVRRPTAGRYAGVVASTALGLLAKPMVVSVPVAMLLLDFWPLGRLELPRRGASGSSLGGLVAIVWPRLREKLLLFALALGGALGALASQRLGGAMAELDALPLSVRVGNAFLSYARYLGKTFWPTNLSAFYAFPEPPADWRSVLPAAILFVALTAFASSVARRWPWICFGWLWFTITLLPVIGLVQVGDQAMADRYTYLPSVGLLVALVWSVAAAARSVPARAAVALAAAAALFASFVATRAQIRWWRDTPTLFAHMLEIDPDNHVGHLNLGTWLSGRGRVREAVPHLRRAVELRPDIALAHGNLGSALQRSGDLAGAERALLRAIELEPEVPHLHVALATVYADEGKIGLAAGHLARAVSLDPTLPQAWEGLADLLSRPGGAREALPYIDALAREYRSSPELQRLAVAVRARAGELPRGARDGGSR